MIRRGWLERGPGPTTAAAATNSCRCAWDKALDLLGAELTRVRDTHGPGAVFGGSYGWASAGRFHHAQSQIHRFLNIALGGYVRSVNSYSSGAASVIMPARPRRLRGPHQAQRHLGADRPSTPRSCVAFGGMALKNAMVAGGGISKHVERGAMDRARAQRGCDFVLVGPLRDDLPDEAGAEWISRIPGTDTALMLGLVHTLVARRAARPRLPRSLQRRLAGLRALPDWARRTASRRTPPGPRAITGIDAETIRALARRLHGRRALIVVSHSLQRAEHGEQPVWMGGRAGGGARPDRPARRRLRLCARRHRAIRPARQRRARWPTPAAGPQRRRGLHPGRAHRRHAAQSGRDLPLQRPDADLSRHPAGLLGRRQPVPSPPGPQPAAPSRSPASIRSWCTSSPGPPRRATPTSCCPAP